MANVRGPLDPNDILPDHLRMPRHETAREIALMQRQAQVHAETERIASECLNFPPQASAMDYFFVGTSFVGTMVIDAASPPTGRHYNRWVYDDMVNMPDPRAREKENRKKFKAECKAQQLIEDFIGHHQWHVYRRTNRVIIKPGKFWWIVGNYFGNYVKAVPFSNKPDVIRIDDVRSGSSTSFCVDQRGGNPTPYTDKVIAFTVHLLNDEQGFYKMANKINELKFDPKKECAIWNIS